MYILSTFDSIVIIKIDIIIINMFQFDYWWFFDQELGVNTLLVWFHGKRRAAFLSFRWTLRGTNLIKPGLGLMVEQWSVHGVRSGAEGRV